MTTLPWFNAVPIYTNTDGHIWVYPEGKPPEIVDADYLLKTMLRNRGKVKLAGHISQLQNAFWLKNNDITVFVGTPSVLPAPKKRSADPSLALASLSVVDSLPAFFGGWRQLAGAVENSLALTYTVHSGNAEYADAYYEHHPCYHAMKMFAGNSKKAAQKILADISDVRYFNSDPAHPERESCLYSFLGISNAVVCRFLEWNGKDKIKGTNSVRFQNLVAATFGPEVVMKSTDTPSWMVHSQQNFAQAMYKQQLHNSPPELALRKTLEYCVSYIKANWLHETSSSGQEVFVPEYFFDKIEYKGSWFSDMYRTTVRKEKIVD